MSTTIKFLAGQLITDALRNNFTSVSTWNCIVDLVRLTGEVHLSIQFGRIQGIPEKYKSRRKYLIDDYLNCLRKIQKG